MTPLQQISQPKLFFAPSETTSRPSSWPMSQESSHIVRPSGTPQDWNKSPRTWNALPDRILQVPLLEISEAEPNIIGLKMLIPSLLKSRKLCNIILNNS